MVPLGRESWWAPTPPPVSGLPPPTVSCIRVPLLLLLLYQGCQTGLTAHLMSTCASQENNEKADLQTDFLKGNRRLTKIKIMTSSYCSLGGEVQFQGMFVTDIFNNSWIITRQLLNTLINVIDIVIFWLSWNNFIIQIWPVWTANSCNVYSYWLITLKPFYSSKLTCFWISWKYLIF